MKKAFLSLALLAASVTAFAVPNPRQIEQALERGNCAQARNLVNEVLAAKPDSARAHLLNSATIMCLEKDPALAQRELNAARELDHKGDVTSSNLFAKMEGDIAAAQRPVYTPPAQTYVAPAVVAPAPAPQPAVVAPAKDEGSSFLSKFFVLLLLAAGVGALVYFFRRSKQESEKLDNLPVGGGIVGPDLTPAASTISTSSGTYSSSGSRSSASPAYSTRRYTAPPAPVYRAPAPAPVVVNNGPSALETGVAVAGGVVAGNMISDALRKPAHDTYERRRRDEDTSSVYSSSSPTYTAPAPSPAPAPSSYSSSSDEEWGSSSSSRYSSSSSTSPAPAPSSWSSSSDDDSSSRSSSWSSSSSSDYSSSSSSDYSSSSSSDSSSSSSSSDW